MLDKVPLIWLIRYQPSLQNLRCACPPFQALHYNYCYYSLAEEVIISFANVQDSAVLFHDPKCGRIQISSRMTSLPCPFDHDAVDMMFYNMPDLDLPRSDALIL